MLFLIATLAKFPRGNRSENLSCYVSVTEGHRKLKFGGLRICQFSLEKTDEKRKRLECLFKSVLRNLSGSLQSGTAIQKLS